MNAFKGFWGELKLRLAMRLFLFMGWQRFHNVTIKLPRGGTSQIDHILISRSGIFVIETKNYKGLIRASVDARYWQQIFRTAAYSFYNPIKQNEGHISSLKYMLKNKQPPFHNIICFVGDARFESVPPANVSVGIMGAIKLIKQNRKKVLTKSEVKRISKDIQFRRMPNNRKTRRTHLNNVKSKQDNLHK